MIDEHISSRFTWMCCVECTTKQRFLDLLPNLSTYSSIYRILRFYIAAGPELLIYFLIEKRIYFDSIGHRTMIDGQRWNRNSILSMVYCMCCIFFCVIIDSYIEMVGDALWTSSFWKVISFSIPVNILWIWFPCRHANSHSKLSILH